MAGIAPARAGSVEQRLDAAAGRNLARIPTDTATRLWDARRAPAVWLAHIAAGFGITDWSPDWGEGERRTAIENAFARHRNKGTWRGLRDALTAIGAAYDYADPVRKTDPSMATPPAHEARLIIRNAASLRLPPSASIADVVRRHKRGVVKMTIEASAPSLSGVIFISGGIAAIATAQIDLIEDPSV